MKISFVIFIGIIAILVLGTVIKIFIGWNAQGSGDMSDVSFDIDVSGREIVFSGRGDGGRDLYLLNLLTKKVARITKTPLWERTPSFSPGGENILFAASNKPGSPSHIYICSKDGSRMRPLTSGEAIYDDEPMYSPDGKRVVFARAARRREYSMGGYTWDNWDIYVINSDGSGLNKITNENFSTIYAPIWFNNGRQLLICGGKGIFVLSIDNGKREYIIDSGVFPCLSHDNIIIGYIHDENNSFDYDLWIFSIKNKESHQLTSLKSYLSRPRFLPDDSKILFLSDPARDHRYRLWQVDANGHNPQEIADSSLFTHPMRWK